MILTYIINHCAFDYFCLYLSPEGVPCIQMSYLRDNCCLVKSTNNMLHEVLYRNAIADNRMQGTETPNDFAQSSSDVLAGKIDDGNGRTTSGTDEEILSTGG